MAAAQDNLACKGTGMNWYTSMVGETPCQTYQKLRQICNSQFTVGVMNPNTPPDFCTDQVSTCCCNNIAFSLAMLCLNCQQDIGTGSGLDAGVGAYQIYLNGSTGTQSCANPQSGKLPNDIQTAACNQKIKINNDIYTNGWPDGSWFYVFTRDTIVKDNIVANNNSFTHCASTTINTSSSSSASGSKTASSNKPSGTQAGSGGGDNNTNATSKSSSLATGAIAGIAVGAAVLAIAAVLAFWFCRKRQRRTQAGVLGGPFEGRSSAGGGRETAVLNDSLVAHGYNYTSDEATASRTPATSDYFAAPQSEAGGSSVPGFAGLGAGSAAGVGYGVGLGTAYAAGGPGGYDPHSTSSDGGQISPRRGFHTTGASTSSFASLPNPHGGASAAGAAAVGAAAAAGSTSGSGSGRDRSGSGAASGAASLSGSRSSGRQEERRAQAPPLPRKRARGAAAPAAAAPAAPAVGRAPSEEPFLEEEDHEREPWRDVDLDLDRHQDGGPVSDVSLGRSASGRLPPAYGAIHPER